MLQPSKISRSSLDLQNTDLQSILADTAPARFWQSLTNLLRLPNDLISFLLFLSVLTALCGGLILHIHLSSRVLQTRFDIAEKRALFNTIKQQNSEIVWQINQSSSLDKVKQRAVALGYVEMPEHQYIGAVQLDPVWAVGAPSESNSNVDNQTLVADSHLAAGDSQLPNNTQPLSASSSSNTAALSLANPMSYTDPASQTSSMVDQWLSGSADRMGQLRQWIQGWLPVP